MTRRRIVDAAAKLFRERGYAATTMAAIASEASVAVQTVYFIFHTKTELLSAVADLAITAGVSSQPDTLPWTAAALAEPDGGRRIGLVVEATAEIAPRMVPIVGAWRAAIAADPSAGAVYRERLLGRRAFLRRVVDATAERGQLRPDLDRERATDVFFALTTPETFETLTRLLGWSVSAWAAWTKTALERELLA